MAFWGCVLILAFMLTRTSHVARAGSFSLRNCAAVCEQRSREHIPHLGHVGGSHGDKAVALALAGLSVLNDAHVQHCSMVGEQRPHVLL